MKHLKKEFITFTKVILLLKKKLGEQCIIISKEFTYFKVLHALANLLDITCALGSHNERSFWWGINSTLPRHQILEI